MADVLSHTAVDLRGQIEMLCEAGEDGGGWMGYWCKDHVDPHLFAYAANYDFGHDDPEHRRHVKPEHVKHIWWRKVPIAGEPGMLRYLDAEPGSRGAFRATVADIQAWNYERDARRRKEWQDSARRQALAEALQFCAARFGADYADLVTAWNESRGHG